AIEAGERAVALSPFQAHLVALIYGSEQGCISRSEAAWFLWEECDHAIARHRISQLLYSLRKRTSAACVVEGPDNMTRGGFPSDLQPFTSIQTQPDVQAMRTAQKNGFLTFRAPPTPAYSH